MKWLRSNKGSTLMLIVITIAILGMLGTALLAMSFMNFNMKQNDIYVKRTSYYAESGIDQVYSRIGWMVENSINDALMDTDSDMIGIMTDLISMQESGVLVAPNDIYLTADMMIDTALLEAKAEELYKGHFRNAFASQNFNQHLELVDYLAPQEGDGVRPTITVGSYVGFTADPDDPSVMIFEIRDVSSEFILKNKTKKTIRTDIIISDSLSEYPLTTLEKRITVKDNPIWQKPLVATENIEFDSDLVMVIGDVYGYGTYPTDAEAIRTADATAYGGVIASGSTDVTINGSVFSKTHVQLGEDSTGNMSIENGLVYSNSFITQKGADGTLSVDNGNVYTSDDLEMNGDRGSQVIIKGSYFGYTDGSATGISDDASSAIVLNTDMSYNPLTTNSYLEITGDTLSADHRGHEEVYGGITQAGILVAGTSFIDTYDSSGDPNRYQTGESVSFRGNYIAYSWGFGQDIVNQITGADHAVDDGINHFAQNPYDFYDNATHDTDVTLAMLRDPSKFEPYWNSSGTSSVNLRKSTGELKDKMAYFITFEQYIPSGLIEKGDSANVKLSNYIYSTGLQLLTGDFVYGGNTGFSSYNSHLRSKITDDYLYQLHMMKYRDSNDTSTIEAVYDYDRVTGLPIPGETATVQNANVVDKYTRLDTGSYNYWSMIDAADINTPSNTVKEIKTVNNLLLPSSEWTVPSFPEYEPLRLYAGGASIPGVLLSGNSYNVDSEAQGVIVNKGDIHIYGNLTFTGPIITDGDIYTHSGNQTFANDSEMVKEYLAHLIYDDDTLFELFEVTKYDDNRGTQNLVFLPETYTDVEVFVPSQTYDVNNNSAFTYNDWIYFSNWNIQ